jgi:hypothetical protein
MSRKWKKSLVEWGRRLRKALVSAGSWIGSILSAARVGHALGFGFSAFVLIMATYPLVTLINWSLTLERPVWGLIVVGVSAVLLVICAGLISNEQVLRDLDVEKFRWPTVFSVALAWVAVVVFGGATCGLQRIGVVKIQPVEAYTERCALHYADFYLWHLLDSIPGIKFTETVHWTQKYTYSDSVSGWLLLGFKIIVLVSVIGSFVTVARIQRDRPVEQPKGQTAKEDSEDAA